jgi:hypothetical protein
LLHVLVILGLHDQACSVLEQEHMSDTPCEKNPAGECEWPGPDSDARWSLVEPPWLARSPALHLLSVSDRLDHLAVSRSAAGLVPRPRAGGTTSGSP